MVEGIVIDSHRFFLTRPIDTCVSLIDRRAQTSLLVLDKRIGGQVKWRQEWRQGTSISSGGSRLLRLTMRSDSER